MIKGERMFKLIKRLIFFIILILFLIFGLFVYKGYDMYKQAIEEMSIEEKIAEMIFCCLNYCEYQLFSLNLHRLNYLY